MILMPMGQVECFVGFGFGRGYNGNRFRSGFGIVKINIIDNRIE